MKKSVIAVILCVIVLASFLVFKTANIIGEPVVRQGDTVKVEYEGKLDSGKVFDSSVIEFEVGSGETIKGFDDAVVGMKIGEQKEFSIPPEDAYGNTNFDLIQEISKSSLPENQEPEIGAQLVITTASGEHVPAKIIELSGESIIIDLNHPLAGENLKFKIKLLEIK